MILRRFLHASDTHFVGTRPVSRLDKNWLATQESVLQFLVDKANENQVPLVLTGDIFEHAVVATSVVNMVIRVLHGAKYGVFIIPGNHELPFHRFEDVESASIGIVLKSFPLIPRINGVQDAAPFGKDVDTEAPVVFTHRLIFRDEASRPPRAVGMTAQELLDALPSAKWIFTGDYHDSYWHTSPDGRHVVNPGCTMVHNASKIGDICRCALVDIDAGTVDWIEIPDDPANLSDSHLRTEEERVSRVTAFLEKVQGQGSARILDFKGNLELKMQQLDPKSPVHKAIVQIQGKAATKEK